MTSFYELVSSGLVISQKIRVDTLTLLWYYGFIGSDSYSGG